MATTYTIDLSQLKWDDANGQFSTVDAAVTVGGAQYTLAAAGTEITLVITTGDDSKLNAQTSAFWTLCARPQRISNQSRSRVCTVLSPSTILSTRRDGAFCRLRLRFVSEEYSAST